MKEAVTKARKYLLASQAADAGWPYMRGQPAVPEPTSYAVMALAAAALSACERGASWLSAWSEAPADGSPDQPCWADPLVLLALLRLNRGTAVRAKLAGRMLNAASRRIPKSAAVELDGNLIGWSWVSGTFGWVEPTSYALLALKAAGYTGHPRVRQGERLLLDRVCEDGGWNYGNKKVLGAVLTSMAPMTALAALALQGSKDAGPVVSRALDLLEHMLQLQRSSLSLALGVLCFDAFGRPSDGLARALLDRQDAGGAWRGQIHLTALSLMALEVHIAGSNAFRVS